MLFGQAKPVQPKTKPTNIPSLCRPSRLMSLSYIYPQSNRSPASFARFGYTGIGPSLHTTYQERNCFFQHCMALLITLNKYALHAQEAFFKKHEKSERKLKSSERYFPGTPAHCAACAIPWRNKHEQAKPKQHLELASA